MLKLTETQKRYSRRSRKKRIDLHQHHRNDSAKLWEHLLRVHHRRAVVATARKCHQQLAFPFRAIIHTYCRFYAILFYCHSSPSSPPAPQERKKIFDVHSFLSHLFPGFSLKKQPLQSVLKPNDSKSLTLLLLHWNETNSLLPSTYFAAHFYEYKKYWWPQKYPSKSRP